jgi:hypothetical protein
VRIPQKRGCALPAGCLGDIPAPVFVFFLFIIASNLFFYDRFPGMTIAPDFQVLTALARLPDPAAGK